MLKKGDLIRLGRVKFRVRELKGSANLVDKNSSEK